MRGRLYAPFLLYRKLLVSNKAKRIYMPAQFSAAQKRATAMRNAREARFLVLEHQYRKDERNDPDDYQRICKHILKRNVLHKNPSSTM